MENKYSSLTNVIKAKENVEIAMREYLEACRLLIEDERKKMKANTINNNEKHS